MRSFVTVMHTGARFVVDNMRRAGISAGYHRNDQEADVRWWHVYERGLPPPEECFTLLRDPIMVLASHDTDGSDGPGRRSMAVLSRSYQTLMRYVEEGCLVFRVEDGLDPITDALGLPKIENPVIWSPRVTPLTEKLAEHELAVDEWFDPRLPKFWLEEMEAVDAFHAERGYDIWWR